MFKLVYQKEMMELLRDKKTLVFMILLPLFIFPALFGGLAFFSVKTIQKEQQRVLTYAVVGASQDNPIFSLLKERADLTLYDKTLEANFETAIRDKHVDFVLEVNSNYALHHTQNLQSEWRLHYFNAGGANSAMKRVSNIIKQLNKSLSQQKLIELGLTQSQVKGVLAPIELIKKNVADKKESLGGHLGGFVAYLLLPLCLMGAIYPAIDLAAGEKERGTLESLLIAPISRVDLVLGKFFTIFTASFLTAAVTILSFGLWSFIFAQGLAIDAILNVVGTLGVFDLVLSLFMILPVVLFFSALVLMISVYAKNFKEAQNFITPLSLIILVPLMVAMIPGIKLNWQWALVPISNIALAIKEILKGHAEPFMLSIIWLSQFSLAMIMLAICVYWFSREKVLFR